ncbi:hypothetical protein OCU04_005427 [Sclerotinia nivalis]|uniref:Uncharacterized protein n=1 Tax=Sclerotinia nivalis TaxID=352851 RepID=A0A9X0AP43_9HELO|nr:hypothetical protein OCU04_005427 [Sclerotinia nivalis]
MVTTSNSGTGQDIHKLKQNVVSTLLSWSQGCSNCIEGTFTVKFYSGEKNIYINNTPPTNVISLRIQTHLIGDHCFRSSTTRPPPKDLNTSSIEHNTSTLWTEKYI